MTSFTELKNTMKKYMQQIKLKSLTFRICLKTIYIYKLRKEDEFPPKKV